MMVTGSTITVKLRNPHERQQAFINSHAKRKVIRAGRRSGKTVGIAILACQRFLAGYRVLYAAPTTEQLGRFWFEITRALTVGVDAGIWHKDETEHVIERAGTENRIRAKTAWNSASLRGDYADLLILDEFQLMAEDTWEDVGAPMLLDNDGDAVFIYTPPSLAASGVSKARDPRHAAKMFRRAAEDKTGRWETFHFTSHDNPHLSKEALAEITLDMNRDSYHKEIMAEDDDLQLGLLVYGMFQDRTQVIEPFPVPKEWPRYVGHDFGLANPAALFLAMNPGGELFAWHEYLPGPGKGAYEHVQEWQRLTGGMTVLRRVGGNQTTEEETRQLYTSHGWPISAPKWKEQAKQISLVHGIMERGKLFVFKTLVNYREELANCSWETDNEGNRLNKVKNEAKYHLCACARYIMSEFTPETAADPGFTKVYDLRAPKPGMITSLRG